MTATLAGLERVYLARARELAERGRCSTSPNPPVGAVIVRGTTTLGEGFHRMRGAPHAEAEALRDAAERGVDVRGATLYVTLEPCDHTGLTPPCSQAVIAAGLARVVVGTPDPNPRTAARGLARLRDAGIAVDVVDDERSRRLIAEFAVSSSRTRPYLRLKMASSLDGCIAPRRGVPYWLTGEEARAYVRELRARHDAVLVGAGTVRVDDPRLTVRPLSARRKPYRRVVACEGAAVSTQRAVFAAAHGYDATIVLAPAGLRARFAELEAVADVMYVGAEDAVQLDLTAALERLRAYDVATILCEGGPTLAGRLLALGLVDRFDWLLAPAFLQNVNAVPVFGDGAGEARLRYDRIDVLGRDVLVSGVPLGEQQCSAA
ncbi:MAG: bifunctional diaminohydroxyphosphoribosylaminopyrimidine deaminase/5-amino-6-(5-phosphoribosylamino)uracil reductase RibD [Candidatus Eremiobacteraeota bacterium]|nr:bifunctional diaminohydroxyphosphoribosylaminopyrimidine deaminase/5-amino-6-(5-phosphoribosylamino)uracil reductase RibD [Candidatus Eremiobacteraeota bacterium]MBC5803237.1 bifunctional diaminohydroxyphosphoribosylaminopyrimidine deaminase/5-amino-6-(5-phosphoribosylamino)uracil reductase RibD [Candidatus Eremiobacteraeota bacterium]MBC5823045.1 bifunctional diaminohydroxyphosphoribosylaminopyrimidine deaminase/5-amino-6-(5-phosphoribosylamino)uracil reductase RibD [Candidatus Eremiobacterae